MSAQDSNNKADAKNIELDRQQMTRIQTAINTAIKKGLYEVMVYETLSQPNIDQLQSEAYQVYRRGGRMGENNYLIKWNSPQDDDNPTVDTTYYPGGTPDPHPSL